MFEISACPHGIFKVRNLGVCPPVRMSLGQGLYVEFFWLVLLIRYRVEEEEKPFGVQIGPKLSKFSVSAMPFVGKKLGY